MKKLFPVLYLFSCLVAAHSFAGSATWNLNPTTSDWNKGANWTPATVPNGPNDTATFDVSNTTAVSLSDIDEVAGIVYNPGAAAFTTSIHTGSYPSISGVGITNNSDQMQNFVVTTDRDPGGVNSAIVFLNSATAGISTSFTIDGGAAIDFIGAFITFRDTASAGEASFTVKGSHTHGAFSANITFEDSSTAGNGTFVLEGGIASGLFGGFVFFDFFSSTNAGNGTFIVNGGTTSGAFGGSVGLAGGTAGNATFIANPGTNGGAGGTIDFYGADGGEARIEVFGNGTLNVNGIDAPPLTIGSIEGDGLVILDSATLVTGANNLSTTFSGTIQDSVSDPGSMEKIGTGLLTLTGANTYTGGTTINGGTLKTGNTIGSATGTGPVILNAGILGGQGTIAGPVTVGSGTGPGAILAPGAGSSGPRRLTLQSSLTFKADGDYACQFNTKRGRADGVIAHGVVIENGAQFAFGLIGNKPLNLGKVFTIISNTSANPISGTFANLADGSILTDGKNHYQVSYSGGNGNDLTFTVVP